MIISKIIGTYRKISIAWRIAKMATCRGGRAL